MRFEDQRKLMVKNQLINKGICDSRVIKAFEKIPREMFVNDEWKDLSYKDHPLDIGLQQTISQPFIIALMMSLLKLVETDIVLEIGTGSGYLTALLAEIVAEVYTVERIDELMVRAKKTLKTLDYSNIYFKIGDGSLGWVNAIPNIKKFDKIIISAASPHSPTILLSQLKENGLLVIPEGSLQKQDLVLYQKKGDEVLSHKCCECSFVPLIGIEGWNDD